MIVPFRDQLYPYHSRSLQAAHKYPPSADYSLIFLELGLLVLKPKVEASSGSQGRNW